VSCVLFRIPVLVDGVKRKPAAFAFDLEILGAHGQRTPEIER